MLDDETLELTKPYIGISYVRRSHERSVRCKKKFAAILTQGRLPEVGFPEAEIEALLLQLASLDANNWENSAGVGEREGRVLVDFIRRRHYGLTHGIGRSGDVSAIQPKAPGSSLINRLTNQLLLDWLRRSGSPSTAHCFLVPMATGMSLTLCLLALKKRRLPGACFVLWPRIDQKSCFKCMITAGLIPVPIELITDEDQLCCDLEAIREALERPANYLFTHWPDVAKSHGLNEKNVQNYNSDSIVCVLSTTTCFAPRVPDRLHAITKECVKFTVPHLINNAYGVQSPRCMRMIEAAGEYLLKYEKKASDNHKLPIDMLYVQSTDKNLLVPVGGAVVAGFCTELVNFVAKLYPGRASATPSIDVLCTLLRLGIRGWTELVDRQSVCFAHLRENLKQVADQYKLRLLNTPSNPISLALSLNGLLDGGDDQPDEFSGDGRQRFEKELLAHITQISAHLFTQGCSGVRIVLPSTMQKPTKLDLYEFPGFNSHSSKSTTIYLNAAAAIGQKEHEVNLFIQRLDKSLQQYKRNRMKLSLGKSEHLLEIGL